MPPRQSNRSTQAVPRRPSRTGAAEGARIAASAYIVGNYPIGSLGGTPQRLTLDGRPFWIVPIVLTSPGYGAVGEVGLVAMDAATQKVVGSTPRGDVVAAAKRLREAKRDELEAAFLQARTV